jgi:ABC-2 type transport system ATP-binding protein
VRRNALDWQAGDVHHLRMASMAIELRDLAKSYGRTSAVKGISLGIQPGEIVGLLGPNGAGKSTTISMLAGLLAPSSGDILLDGVSVLGRLPEWRRSIGVVLEELSLFEYLSVGEHLSFMGRLYGLSPAETERRADELLEFFQLAEYAQTLAAEASQGTRKKLAFALALLHSPRLLLLDEALNGIDAVVVRDIKGLLRRLADRGAAIVLSSHVLDAAEAIVSRCVIVDKGRIVRDDPIAAVRASGRSLEELYTDTVRGGGAAAPALSWA